MMIIPPPFFSVPFKFQQRERSGYCLRAIDAVASTAPGSDFVPIFWMDIIVSFGEEDAQPCLPGFPPFGPQKCCSDSTAFS